MEAEHLIPALAVYGPLPGHQLIQQLNAYPFQTLFHLHAHLQICIGGTHISGRMVVAQQYIPGVAKQGLLCHMTGLHADIVDTPYGQSLCAQHLPFTVQTDKMQSFIMILQ